jgi:hypothetical protein
MKKKITFLILLCTFISHAQNVGVNTTNPQQALHIAGATGTIRVEGLNNPNNSYNGGGANNTFPLFVDNNGDFTINTSKSLQNSGGTIAWSPSSLTTSSITVPNTGTGNVTALLYSQTITVTKPSVLELKYSLSFSVKKDASNNIESSWARSVTNYFTLDAATRPYAQSGKCFYSNDTSANNASGIMYNGANAHIVLPSAGTYVLKLWGEVSSGSDRESTLVNFGTGASSFFLKLY